MIFLSPVTSVKLVSSILQLLMIQKTKEQEKKCNGILRTNLMCL